MKTRLYFIDIARTIAIMLMLEGHFVHDSLAPEWCNEAYTPYTVWKFIRGFTSPIFLTVTGIVFTYLMLGNETSAFLKNIRIRKGFKRVVELLFWGYLLQYYAFHVLQCIGIGIFCIISLYGLSRLLKVIPLWSFYLVAGTALFFSYLFFGNLGTSYWPQQAPAFIQNIFHGKYSLFPITPHMGYTMYGAMIGVFLYHHKEKVKTLPYILGGFAIGLSLFFGIKPLLLLLQQVPGWEAITFYQMDWLYEKLGMVFIVLSLLIALETYLLNIQKNNLFLKIGQNTLSIYIVHMIVLYGSITRIGLTDFLHHRLSPYEIIPYTLGFWLVFI
ncbi:MAG: hypothetical protein RLZZ301_1257, partial [Bacteroidota bacterium]